MASASADDLAELSSGKASARDRAEAAASHQRSKKTHRKRRARIAKQTKRRSVRRPRG